MQTTKWNVWRVITIALIFVLKGSISAYAQFGDHPNDEEQRPPNPNILLPTHAALSPQEALKTFILPAGFHIEVVAAEPMVHDPVMMAFDARGRLWVAELGAYNAEIIKELPIYLEKGKPLPDRPEGRVVYLESTHHDGVYDKRTVYWDHMNVPRAIAFVRDQVVIGDPPNLWITKDTVGDGVMHKKVLIAKDYGTPENIEASANGLLWGRDNWLYNASYKLRWREIDGMWESEPMPALGQWGISQDDFGRLYYDSNSDQLRGDFVPSHYAAMQDRHIPLYGTNFQIATDQSTWPSRPTPGVNRGYQKAQLRTDGTLATFTAASAPVIYRGNNFPASFNGNAFVPEPAGNLVKRTIVLEAEGRLSAINAYDGIDFLTSTDERFRPVFTANGPDGALYVVDYYRGMLEGYQFATTYLRNQIIDRKLNSPLWGMGRIYRIVYDKGALNKTPDFVHAKPVELVRLLEDANGWTRDTAQRVIVESHNAAFIPLLRERLQHAQLPRDRVSALWCLEGLGAISVQDVDLGIHDSDSHVRIASIQAGESLLRSSDGSGLIKTLSERVATEEPAVLNQLALSLSGVSDKQSLDLLWAILNRANEHPSLRDGILIGLKGHETEVLTRLLKNIHDNHGNLFGTTPLLEDLALHLVVAGKDATQALTKALADSTLPQPARFALFTGATKVSGLSLGEDTLNQIATVSPDVIVKAKAKAMANAIHARLAKRAARASVPPLTAEQKVLFDQGSATFGLCAACHQPDGLGKANVAPALKEGRWADAVSPDSAIRIVLKGKEGTPGFPAAMPPLGSMSDEQLAGVLTYVRRSFGNMASAVSPADVARVRRIFVSRVNAWTDAELAKLDPEAK
jgi:mono/diheme cytochrome c family protein/glucose/arabinose dehydrogenase